MGGSWERMVKSVKRCLKKTLGRSLLTFEEITTIVCEIEAVLTDQSLIVMMMREVYHTQSLHQNL